ncbi:MAG: hypothetical protein ABSF90_13440 [Syntrophobacteraceae bacterium]|jgi:hypothetical protein
MKGQRCFYIICASSREDMLPTSYYDPNGKLILDKNGVAKFLELEHVFEFIAKHEINLGDKAYVGLMIEDDGGCETRNC